LSITKENCNRTFNQTTNAMKLLFLDDYRAPQDCLKYMHTRIGSENLVYQAHWEVVKNYPEFVKWIEKNGLPTVISFDHDLADGHYHANMQQGELNYQGNSFDDDYNKTGYHCAKWLIDYCLDNDKKLPRCIVHSMNPVGTENIQALLTNFQKL
jgi:hypothetical protein